MYHHDALPLQEYEQPGEVRSLARSRKPHAYVTQPVGSKWTNREFKMVKDRLLALGDGRYCLMMQQLRNDVSANKPWKIREHRVRAFCRSYIMLIDAADVIMTRELAAAAAVAASGSSNAGQVTACAAAALSAGRDADSDSDG